MENDKNNLSEESLEQQVDSIFSNLDTPEYQNQKKTGGFDPLLSNDDTLPDDFLMNSEENSILDESLDDFMKELNDIPSAEVLNSEMNDFFSDKTSEPITPILNKDSSSLNADMLKDLGNDPFLDLASQDNEEIKEFQDSFIDNMNSENPDDMGLDSLMDDIGDIENMDLDQPETPNPSENPDDMGLDSLMDDIGDIENMDLDQPETPSPSETPDDMGLDSLMDDIGDIENMDLDQPETPNPSETPDDMGLDSLMDDIGDIENIDLDQPETPNPSENPDDMGLDSLMDDIGDIENIDLDQPETPNPSENPDDMGLDSLMDDIGDIENIDLDQPETPNPSENPDDMGLDSLMDDIGDINDVNLDQPETPNPSENPDDMGLDSLMDDIGDIENMDLDQPETPNPSENPDDMGLENLMDDIGDINDVDLDQPETPNPSENPNDMGFDSLMNDIGDTNDLNLDQPTTPDPSENPNDMGFDSLMNDINDIENMNSNQSDAPNPSENPNDMGFDNLMNDIGDIENINLEEPTEDIMTPFGADIPIVSNNQEEDINSFLRDEISSKKNQEQERSSTGSYFDINRENMDPEIFAQLQAVLDSKEAPAETKETIINELNKQSPDVFMLEELLEQTKSKIQKGSSRFFNKKLAFRFFLPFMAFVGIYLVFFSPSASEKKNLEKGLRLIERREFKPANLIFNNNNPNLHWYNRYAQAFMHQGAYDLAQEKLLGLRDNGQILEKGALDINSKDKETLLNLGELYLREGEYEKAISSASNEYSLSYLHSLYPEDFKVVDILANAYIEWAARTKDDSLKKDYYNKATQLYYKLYTKDEDNTKLLSRLLTLSILTDNNVLEKIKTIQNKGLENKLEDSSLAQLGLYYLNRDKAVDATILFNILRARIKKVKDPLVFYMLGQYYYKARDYSNAETNFIKGINLNSIYDKNHNYLNSKDNIIQAKLSNGLGQIYIHMIPQYSGGTADEQKKRAEFIRLAQYHFNQAKQNAPEDPMTYYLSGNLEYSVNHDYNKTILNLTNAYDLLKKKNESIPSDLAYNLGVSLYKEGRYKEALQILLDLRSHKQLYYPSLEYILGMTYLKNGVESESIVKLQRTLEYFEHDINYIKEKAIPTSLRDNQVLFFTAIANNNLGVIYQTQGSRENNSILKTKARTYFYQSLENANRIDRKFGLIHPKLNLKNSLLEDNVQYTENFKISGREPLLYEYIPEFIEDYQ